MFMMIKKMIPINLYQISTYIFFNSLKTISNTEIAPLSPNNTKVSLTPQVKTMVHYSLRQPTRIILSCN